MKIRHTTKVIIPTILLMVFASCKKTSPNILNMFKVQLAFNKSTPYAVDENGEIELASQDSVLIDYTIESPDADMYMICLYKAGGNLPDKSIPITDGGKRRVYSGTFKFYAKDLGAGLTSFRIWALDQAGVYLGDGYKHVTISVVSDLKYYSNLKLFAADSASTETPTFLSLSDSKTYTYAEAATRSGSIDFGLYRKLIPSGTTLKEEIYLYATNANPNPYPTYNLSSWTKKGTLFSAPVTKDVSPTSWKTRFNTGPKIEAEAKLANINLTNATLVDGNQFIFYKTAEGKVGVMFIISKNLNYLMYRYLWMSFKTPV